MMTMMKKKEKREQKKKPPKNVIFLSIWFEYLFECLCVIGYG